MAGPVRPRGRDTVSRVMAGRSLPPRGDLKRVGSGGELRSSGAWPERGGARGRTGSWLSPHVGDHSDAGLAFAPAHTRFAVPDQPRPSTTATGTRPGHHPTASSPGGSIYPELHRPGTGSSRTAGGGYTRVEAGGKWDRTRGGGFRISSSEKAPETHEACAQVRPYLTQCIC